MSISCFLANIAPIFTTFKNIRRIFRISRSPSFPKKQNCGVTRFWYFKNNIFQTNRDCSWIIWSLFVPPTLNLIGLGSHGHAHQVRKLWKWDFPKRKLKVTSPKWNRIILQSFWATFLMKFTIKMVPQTPQTPNLDFPDFPRFSIGNRPLFGLYRNSYQSTGVHGHP